MSSSVAIKNSGITTGIKKCKLITKKKKKKFDKIVLLAKTKFNKIEVLTFSAYNRIIY